MDFETVNMEPKEMKDKAICRLCIHHLAKKELLGDPRCPSDVSIKHLCIYAFKTKYDYVQGTKTINTTSASCEELNRLGNCTRFERKTT